jgi:adenine-specific DNA glycosylase
VCCVASVKVWSRFNAQRCRCVTRFPCKAKATKVRCDSVASLVLLVTNSAALDSAEFPMILLQKRAEGGLLGGLWECPTATADEAAPVEDTAAELLALARQSAAWAAAAADGGEAAALLGARLSVLPACDVRAVGQPFVHMFSHIHRSVRVYGAKVDLNSAKLTRCPPPAAAARAPNPAASAQLHSISRLSAAGVPTLTRKVLCSAAAALGFVL